MAARIITVVVEDEGYLRKTYGLKPETNLKKLTDMYSRHLCRVCSRPEMLEFWYEATKLDNQTAKILGMQDGDIIDVRIKEQCTRGACPIPAGQTLPNIHYLAHAPAPTPASQNDAAVREQDDEAGPEAPDRILIHVKDVNNPSITLRMKKSTRMILAMQAFAHHIKREVKDCRFLCQGDRLNGTETPASLELEDEDQVDVFYEQQGGRAALAGI